MNTRKISTDFAIKQKDLFSQSFHALEAKLNQYKPEAVIIAEELTRLQEYNTILASIQKDFNLLSQCALQQAEIEKILVAVKNLIINCQTKTSQPSNEFKKDASSLESTNLPQIAGTLIDVNTTEKTFDELLKKCKESQNLIAAFSHLNGEMLNLTKAFNRLSTALEKDSLISEKHEQFIGNFAKEHAKLPTLLATQSTLESEVNQYNAIFLRLKPRIEKTNEVQINYAGLGFSFHKRPAPRIKSKSMVDSSNAYIAT